MPAIIVDVSSKTGYGIYEFPAIWTDADFDPSQTAVYCLV